MQTAPAFEEGIVYAGTIQDQMLSKTPRKGEMMLSLGIKIDGKLKNKKAVADGIEPCPPQEQEVVILFPEDDENRLRIGIDHLEQLGFTDDIRKLHPEHPEFFSI